MKQSGKTWINCQGQDVPQEYVTALDKLSEKLGQQIFTAANDLHIKMMLLKGTMITLCQKVYAEHLKRNPAVTVFSFYAFDRTFRVEYDTVNKYVRVYKATKNNPQYKDFELINLDFSKAKETFKDEPNASKEPVVAEGAGNTAEQLPSDGNGEGDTLTLFEPPAPGSEEPVVQRDEELFKSLTN